MNRIGITGANGFIGKHFVEKFIKDGYEVVAFVRDKKKIDFLKDAIGEFEIVEGDVTDEKALEKFVKKCDAVVHLAAGTKGSYEDYYDSTVGGAGLIFDLCARHKIKKLVYISSISVYDLNAVKRGVADETTPFDQHLDLRGWYAKTKALGEKTVTEKFSEKSVPTIVLRPGLVYAPNFKAPLMGCGIIIRNRCLNLGMRKKKLPFIHINDLYEAIKLSVNSRIKNQIFNVVSDEQPKISYILKLYNRYSPRPLKPLFIPKIFFIFNHLFDGLLSKKSRLGRYNYLLTRTQKNIYYSNDKIKKELNWRAKISFKTTMEEMMRYNFEPVKTGVVGCGFAFKTLHLPVLHNNPRMKVVALYDSKKENALEMKEKFFKEAMVADNLEDFIKNNELNFVVICTPPASHFTIAKKLIENGINLLIEKPLTLDVKEAEALQKLSGKNNVKVGVINNYRFRDNVSALYNSLPSFQKVETISVKFWSGPIIESEGSWRSGLKDALLYEMAYHFIDIAVQLGGEIKKITYLNKEENNNGLIALETKIRTMKNKIINLDLKMFPPYAQTRIEVMTENAAYVAGFYPESFYKISGGQSPLSDLKRTVKTILNYLISTKIKKNKNISHQRVYDGFVNALKDVHERIPVTVNDTLPTMKTIKLLLFKNAD